jgi:CheY-like chemotaxis protein
MMDASHRGPVLVVEDHPVNRLLLERVLEFEQIEVLSAESIEQARHQLDATVPPVIVLDLQLPDGDGLDFVRELKSDPRTSSCAVIACTARGAPDERHRALAAGCAAYVPKPIDTRSFASLVCSLIPSSAGQSVNTS